MTKRPHYPNSYPDGKDSDDAEIAVNVVLDPGQRALADELWGPGFAEQIEAELTAYARQKILEAEQRRAGHDVEAGRRFAESWKKLSGSTPRTCTCPAWDCPVHGDPGMG